MARFARQVVLLFDGDAAGSTAAMRACEALLGTGLDARVVSLPAEHDPDTFVQEHGADVLLERAENAQSVLDFYLEQLAQQHDLSSVEGKAHAIERLKPLLAKPRDAVRRDLLLREVVERLSVDEQSLRHDLQASMLRRQRPHMAVADGQTTSLTLTASRAEGQTTAPPDPPRHELEFMGLLLNFPQLIPETVREFAPDSLSDARIQALCRAFFDHHAHGKAIDLGMIISELEDDTLSRLAVSMRCPRFRQGTSRAAMA